MKVHTHKAGSGAEGFVSQGEERDQKHGWGCQSNREPWALDAN